MRSDKSVSVNGNEAPLLKCPTDPLDLEPAGVHAVPQLDPAGRRRASREGEAQLVDGQAKVLYLIDGEPHPARQAGRRHTREPQELR
jgi:hypothetical protein